MPKLREILERIKSASPLLSFDEMSPEMRKRYLEGLSNDELEAKLAAIEADLKAKGIPIPCET